MPGSFQNVLDTMKITRPKPRAHPRSEGLREQQRRLHVDRLNRAPHVELEILERPEGDHRRRVDEDVAPAVTLDHERRGPADVTRVAQVNDDVASGAVEDHDSVVGRQPRGDRSADRAGAAGHDGNTTVEPDQRR